VPILELIHNNKDNNHFTKFKNKVEIHPKSPTFQLIQIKTKTTPTVERTFSNPKINKPPENIYRHQFIIKSKNPNNLIVKKEQA
jgi:hypothetical protein